MLAVVAACSGDDAASSAKALTALRFAAADNPGITADVAAMINGDQIAATVPFGTNVKHLVAQFEYTGDKVMVGDVEQRSASTTNDFSSPVIYRVSAEDGSSRDYRVTIAVAPASAKELTSFGFLDAANRALAADFTASINGSAIAVTVPFDTDVSALVATFSTTGVSVKVGGTAQASGTTANDFTSPVKYVVTAVNGSTREYTVTVTVANDSAKQIKTFSFLSVKNPALPADITAEIHDNAITATVPFGTAVAALVATFTHTGHSVKVGETEQESGGTANTFDGPVTYLVTAADGSTRAYTVTVTVAKNTAKQITAFRFLSAKNGGLQADVTATISADDKITAVVPFGTDVTKLVATFLHTGQSLKVGQTEQQTDVTENNFASPVTYVVTAADGTTHTYTVTVTVAKNTAKQITSFRFESKHNEGLSDTAAEIDETTRVISATVPFGTDVTKLIATFAKTGVTVKVGELEQVSEQTENDFTADVTYTVFADDGSHQDYTVKVAVAPAANTITSFSFLKANNPALAEDIAAKIEANAISAEVPSGTDVKALVATFVASDHSVVTVAGTEQDSGETANSFEHPVTYVVTPAVGPAHEYTVTVTIAPATGN